MSRQRAIVAVIQSPVFGGSHNRTLTIEPYLRDAGWRTTVVLPHGPGDAADRLRDGGVDVVVRPLHRLHATLDPRAHLRLAVSLPGEVAELARLMSQHDAELVRVVGIVHPHGALAARRARAAIVWEATDIIAPEFIRRVAMPFVARLADGMLFNGRTLLAAHRRWATLPMPHATYVPPVDLVRFATDASRRKRERASLGVAPDELLIGTVANTNPDKGLEYLVRAAVRVIAVEPRARFMVVGATYPNHATYAAALGDELRAAGLDERRFSFAGPRTDPEAAYAAFDVKVVSSVTEGTTTTALEAMAMGLPVVATDVGAIHEVVADGVTGLLVPSRDPRALAKAVLRLARDPALRAQFGTAARDRAIQRFGAASCARIHVQLFEAAIAHRANR
ncbi:MAG: glycosyltransferase [Candidatus Limnocylindrales bacterium]